MLCLHRSSRTRHMTRRSADSLCRRTGFSGAATLGLRAGDLKARIAGERGATIGISNVILVDRKVHAIEKLIYVKPERSS
jgi:hypothetical protein